MSVDTDFLGTRKHVWKQLNSTTSSYIHWSDEKVTESIQQRRAQCKKSFSILSQRKDFAVIREKISPEVLEYLNQF